MAFHKKIIKVGSNPEHRYPLCALTYSQSGRKNILRIKKEPKKQSTLNSNQADSARLLLIQESSKN